MSANEIYTKTDGHSDKNELLKAIMEIKELFCCNNLRDSDWLTTAEVKARYKITSNTTLGKHLKGFAKRIGGRVLYDRLKIENFLREN